MKKSYNIVCIGGGTGQASILKGLCKISNLNITGITAVTDNGGSSGSIRKSMDIPQPGDTRNCLTAVSDADDIMNKLFQYRFIEGELQGTNLGNLIIAAMTRIFGDFGQAITMANIMLKSKARILPATTRSTHICAQLKNGKNINGEWEIIARSDRSKISKMFLADKAHAYPPCISAIRKADLIIIGPGSLFTAIISNLLVSGISKAIQNSRAKICYIANLMTQPGQTSGFKLSDHVQAIEEYLSKELDFILANNKKISGEVLALYKKFKSKPVQIDRIKNPKRITRASLAKDKVGEAVSKDKRKGSAFREWSLWTHILRHDSDKVAKEIVKLLK